MPGKKRREFTIPVDNDQDKILASVVGVVEGRGIPYEIDQLARKTMLDASKIQGEAFDRFLNRKNPPTREE